MRYFEKKDFTQFCEKAESFGQVLAEKEENRISALKTHNTYTNEMRQGILDCRSKAMGRVFMKGVLTEYWATQDGMIVKADKITQSWGVKNDYKRKVKMFSCCTRFHKTSSIALAVLIAKVFLLPEGDSMKAYTVRLKDGNWSNCKLENLELVKKGSMGAAMKKAVKVMKDGKFYAVFESVSVCSEQLHIPRRRMSEMLTTGKQVNGFTVERFS